jgi:hypothetical protein
METKAALEAYSRGDMPAIELRRRLRGATYGEVLRLLSEQNLPLPRAPVAGREQDIERERLVVSKICRMISSYSWSTPGR